MASHWFADFGQAGGFMNRFLQAERIRMETGLNVVSRDIRLEGKTNLPPLSLHGKDIPAQGRKEELFLQTQMPNPNDATPESEKD